MRKGLLVILGPSLGPYDLRTLWKTGNRRCDTNSINPTFYYILDIEMMSQSLSNFFMELRAAACHNNSQHSVSDHHNLFVHSFIQPD